MEYIFNNSYWVFVSPHTVSGMYFECTEATHATPHHHHVGTRIFVHPLNDLIVQVSVVEVILMDC